MTTGTRALTPCGELADLLDNLPLIAREARRQRGLSMRDAAAQIGVVHSTIARAEHGHDIALSSAIAILRWLDGPTDPKGQP